MKLKILKKKGQFVRNVSVLAGGTIGAQGLLVLASPILSRLYSPSDFGVLAVYMALLGWFSVVMSFRYHLTIPIVEDDKDAANATVLSLLIVLLVSAISVLFVVLFGNKILVLLNSPDFQSVMWVLPLGVAFLGVFQVANYWSIRVKAFSKLGRVKVRQSIITLIMQILGYKFGALALVSGHAVGQGAGSLLLLYSDARTGKFRSVTPQKMWWIARRYKRFPLIDTWYSLLATTGRQLPPIILAAFFSPAAAGLYALATRVLSLPAQLLGQAIGQVFFSKAVVAYKGPAMAEAFRKVLSTLVRIAALPVLVLAIFGAEIFSLVFGAEWKDAGHFAQYMSAWVLFQFITAPLSTLFAISERQAEGVVIQFIIFVSRSLSLLIGFLGNSVEISVALFSLVSALGYLLMLFRLGNIAKVRAWPIILDIITPVLWALVLLLPLLVVKQVELGMFSVVFLCCIFAFISILHYMNIFRSL